MDVSVTTISHHLQTSGFKITTLIPHSGLSAPKAGTSAQGKLHSDSRLLGWSAHLHGANHPSGHGCDPGSTCKRASGRSLSQWVTNTKWLSSFARVHRNNSSQHCFENNGPAAKSCSQSPGGTCVTSQDSPRTKQSHSACTDSSAQ